MIVANIKDAKRYYGINPNFEKSFEFLKTLTETSDIGPAEGDGFKANVSVTETSDYTSDGEPKSLEVHREYLDIHYCIEGSEAIGYAHIDSLEPVAEYDVQNDYMLLKGDMNKVILGKGDFCIVFPEDAHSPAMSAGEYKNVKKAVVKIKDITE